MKYINIVLVVLIVSLLMKYLTASSRKQPTINNEGVLTLKINNIYVVIGYAGIFFSVTTGVIASLGAMKSIQDLINLMKTKIDCSLYQDAVHEVEKI